MALSYKYTNNNGLPVLDELIEQLLLDTGRTEAEIAAFLGETAMDFNGLAFYFLEMLSAQTVWYKSRGLYYNVKKD